MDDALATHEAGSEGPDEQGTPALADHPEVRERIREITKAHYEGWVSEPIRALGGLTPLEAVEELA